MRAVKTRSSRIESVPVSARAAKQPRTMASSTHRGVLRNTLIQSPLPVSQPDDAHEQQADRIAEQVMSTLVAPATQKIQMQAAPAGNRAVTFDTSAAVQAAQHGGSPMPHEVRKYFEPRFGHDFGAVRVHADGDAAQAARSVHASAYTIGNDIVFGAGKYAPGTDDGLRLMAHELAHVVQQGHHGATISRKVELRPPGQGEYSAFGRRQELIDRLNAQSSAIQYHLNGRQLECTIIDQAGLSTFDERMAELISAKVQLIPMRLITKEGRDRRHKAGKVNTTGAYEPVFVDTFVSGYVDLDDLLATDDTSFKLSLIHLLAERAAVPDYARRLGTSFKKGEFMDAHEQTREHDDPAILQDILGDSTLHRTDSGPDTSDPNDQQVVFRYESDRGYSVVRIYHHTDRDLTTGETYVETLDGRRFTIEDFAAKRAAAKTP